MKNKILMIAAGLVLSASCLAIGTTLFMDAANAALAIRLMSVSGFLGLGSIGLFFVGLAFPRDSQ